MKRAIACLGLLLAFVLAGCGSGSTTTTATIPTPPTNPTREVHGHPCSLGNEALQCRLPPAPHQLQLRGSPFTLNGIDAAWGAPSAREARALYGAHFMAGYLSHDPSKDWTRGRVAEYHGAHMGVVMVWETSAGRTGEGCTAGRTDAFYAARESAELGNTTRPIDFAIDFDASGESVARYFRCAQQILGGRVNAYGGYYPLKYLCAHGLVGHENWQTYAWSRSQWLPASCAPLEQYQNGNRVDWDRAIAPAYGQDRYVVAKPSRRQLQERLATVTAHRNGVRSYILHHQCQYGDHRHAIPRTKHGRAVCNYELKRGGEDNHRIKILNEEIRRS